MNVKLLLLKGNKIHKKSHNKCSNNNNFNNKIMKNSFKEYQKFWRNQMMSQREKIVNAINCMIRFLNVKRLLVLLAVKNQNYNNNYKIYKNKEIKMMEGIKNRIMRRINLKLMRCQKKCIKFRKIMRIK